MPTTTPSVAPSTVFSTSILELQGSAQIGIQNQEQYGYALSLNSDGTVLAIGARYYSNSGLRRAGRVTVLSFDSDTNDWILRGQPLYGRNELDQFGFSVSLSADASRMAVSEPGLDGINGDRAGGVRVYEWQQNLQVWNPVGQELEGEGRASLFGVNIKLSGNGNRLAVGSPYYSGILNLGGRTRVYEYNQESNIWDDFGDPLDGTHSSDWFGWAVDLDYEGANLVVGAPRNAEYGGYVRYFHYIPSAPDNETGEKRYGVWVQTGPDLVSPYENSQADDRFGMAVALHDNSIAVGAPWTDVNGIANSGYAAVFQLENTNVESEGQWVLVGEPLTGQEFNEQRGLAISLAGRGKFDTNSGSDRFLAVGSPGSTDGAGRISFHRLTTSRSWDTINSSPRGKEARDSFGASIRMSDDGSVIAVGAPALLSSGGIQVFRQTSI